MAKFVLSAFADEAGAMLSDQIAALKENGINFIEPRNIEKRGILKHSEEELVEIKRILDENAIKVGSLGSPIGKYPIDEPFENHLIDFEKALRACEILGTQNMRMFSFFIPDGRYAEYRDEVILRLKKMVELAKARGIRLCHENEAKIYGEYAEYVKDLLDEIPDLYAIFDPANYRMSGENVMDGIGATLKNLSYLHIKDAIYDSQIIVPAGEGEGRIADILNIVNGHTNERVYLTLEPHLHIFSAYKDIDDHELRGKYTFNSSREAFDYAVNSLKKILTDNGYERNDNNEWTR